MIPVSAKSVDFNVLRNVKFPYTSPGQYDYSLQQKLQFTATSTEERHVTKRITRVSAPILEIACSKEEEDLAHDASSHNQRYSKTIPLYLPSDHDQEKPKC